MNFSQDFARNLQNLNANWFLCFRLEKNPWCEVSATTVEKREKLFFWRLCFPATALIFRRYRTKPPLNIKKLGQTNSLVSANMKGDIEWKKFYQLFFP